jgi:hypothetical protein
MMGWNVAHAPSRIWRRGALAFLALIVILTGMFGIDRMRALAAPVPVRSPTPVVSLADFDQMTFVWASGTPAIQALARQHCADWRMTSADCAAISGAVRQAWRDLLAKAPAALGRTTTAKSPSAAAGILGRLATQLGRITHGRMPLLLAATRTSFSLITSAQWQQLAVIGRPVFPSTLQAVWATAYEQTVLPPGMTTTGSEYAAVPDAYVSDANIGNAAAIPAIYQPYYLPGGESKAHWSITIFSGDQQPIQVTNIPITDVGPWNEDDNWWDPTNTTATLPASCPVSATLLHPDATANGPVDGICPNGHNWRRLYYYLLYQHGGLPFFQPSAYAPSGTFSDGTWPVALPSRCAETAAASINDDGRACAGDAPHTYNGNQGAWLREGVHDGPILNQSSVDLSPAVDAALGWTYPSSGLVVTDTSNLP